MKYLTAIFIILLLNSCNSEMKSRKQVEQLQKSGKAEKYQLGIAYMHYITQPGSNLNYSKELVKRLLKIGFYPESINAVETIAEKIPKGSGVIFFVQYWIP